jgi:hypothetical protein
MSRSLRTTKTHMRMSVSDISSYIHLRTFSYCINRGQWFSKHSWDRRQKPVHPPCELVTRMRKQCSLRPRVVRSRPCVQTGILRSVRHDPPRTCQTSTCRTGPDSCSGCILTRKWELARNLFRCYLWPISAASVCFLCTPLNEPNGMRSADLGST